MKPNNSLMFLLIAMCASSSNAKTIDTASIIESSLNFSCIDWKVTGICIWLQCSLTGCTVNTSVKVKHYNPDAIVQVFNNADEAPWKEVDFIVETLGLEQKGGNTSSTRSNTKIGKNTSAKLFNKESSVIGSPGLIAVNKFLSKMEYFCPSPVQPYQPYFSSGLDKFSWKFPYADYLKPAAFIPGMNEVGEREDGESKTFLTKGRFGSVYPRIGAVYQNEDYRAAAVIAQRTADIVTDTSAMHVYKFLGMPSGGQGKWYPKKIEEWGSKQGKWQMLSPYEDSKCHIFGESMTRKESQGQYIPKSPYFHRTSKTGAYSWALWRPYECCPRKGQKLIKVINF
ncbi:TIGR03756 family integrating conjugative element protein [Vibrio rotiferianus]|uniref:TIGR03756 family integrating conjugative element protein n=1 Tax=Vibrio rotiferianus TaxID=190895 RepID=UPI0005F00071|nr:TIGR03756 family integrating conjugative element protein [Vibrio rotiferianus]